MSDEKFVNERRQHKEIVFPDVVGGRATYTLPSEGPTKLRQYVDRRKPKGCDHDDRAFHFGRAGAFRDVLRVMEEADGS